MTRSLLLALVFLAGCTQSPIALREMGSFHIGGREVEISGKPVKEIAFTPGGSRFVRATRPAATSLRPVPADEAEAPRVAIDAAYQRMRNVLVSDRLRGTE